jgi:hypothetical protein
MAKRRLEIDIETDCVNIAAAAGVPSSKLEKVKRSWPDRAFWVPGGRPWIVEFKRPGETPEPQQAERIEMLRGLGYEISVIDSVTEFRAFFSQYLPAD